MLMKDAREFATPFRHRTTLLAWVVCLVVATPGVATGAKAPGGKIAAPPEPPAGEAPPTQESPPEELPPSAPWVGQLHVDEDRRSFRDEEGAHVLPVFAHFGEAFSAYVRDPDAVERQLQVIKAAGYDGIRFWDNLGYYPEWEGREVTPFGFYNQANAWIPPTPSYYQRLRQFLTMLQRLGLSAHHSRGDLNSVSLNQVVGHSERVRDLYAEVGPDVVALYEGRTGPCSRMASAWWSPRSPGSGC